MKYNRVFLYGLTISQVTKEYEKCIAAESYVASDLNEIFVEHGEQEPAQESINVEEIPETDLHHRNPDDMSAYDMRNWLLSSNQPRKKLKVFKSESLKELVKAFQVTEQKQRGIITLDKDNPEYLEITKKQEI